MNAEVIAVGSELLLGQIANTNARDISAALAEVGVEVTRHTTVGDDLEPVGEAIRGALGRVDVVVLCGGLGPTHDDLTREGLAAATGRPLERRPELVAALEERFERLGRTMAPSNLRQADLPSGAAPIENPFGTAPGVFLEHEGRLLYALPGVPEELEGMLQHFVLPSLSSRTAGAAVVTRMVRTAGVPEADLADRLGGFIERLAANPDGPRLAILASQGEVRACLTAHGASPELAREALVDLEAELRDLLGDWVYGADGDTLEGVVSAMLRERGLCLAVAESLTGGMLTARLVEVPGASDILEAGYVTYSPEAKIRDLGVPPETIERFGLVSTETAGAMAAGARERSGADLGLSTTGEAGPLPSEAEVGQVCIGLAWEGGTAAWRAGFGGSREMIRRRTCTRALNHLRLWLLENPPEPASS